MKAISIFNHVLGPVMRGPSSSHTAGAYHIASMARSILGETPRRAVLAFDINGSYAVTCAAQGADRGFAMGLMGKQLIDESFFTALTDASREGLEIEFQTRQLVDADHPNTVELELLGRGATPLNLVARSVGGGAVEITRIDGRAVRFDGTSHEILVEAPDQSSQAVCDLLANDSMLLEPPQRSVDDDQVRCTARRQKALSSGTYQQLISLDPRVRVWQSAPVYFIPCGSPMFASGAQIVAIAEQQGQSLSRVALAHESQLLGLSEEDVIAEMLRRFEIMQRSVTSGLAEDFTGLQLLPPCADKIYRAEAEGRLSVRSLHTRAAARALAVMHVDASMGVVCAAPTGGSAGVIPGTLVTLAEERDLSREQIALSLLAAGAIGLVLAARGTFAAEVAGCQVEIGASGAMAAAAVVDAVGGSARQACDAAAIAFQNSMGSVCDLLHGTVEIPCHTRNAAAAASAFVNADLILGGYTNFIPLDETIDAVYAVGRAMPSELRCTSKGGLAVTPSAQALTCGRCGHDGLGGEQQ